MCGKALPDLVKQAPRVPAPVSAAPVAPSAPARRAAPRVENPNRDLSYLLDDDHVPTARNWTPYIVGGLLLAAVAGFFVLRGGGKPAPASGAADGGAVEIPAAETTAAAAKPGPVEGAKSEGAKAAEAGPPPEIPPVAKKMDLPAVEAAPPREVRHGAPVAKAAPVAKPLRASKKPSPSKTEGAAVVEPVADVATASANDCEKQMPRLRKAALGADAKAKSDLGLAYYTGHCAARDLPTAYHWYALALRAAPESPLVSAQLEAIWKQMSPAERQLALKAQ